MNATLSQLWRSASNWFFSSLAKPKNKDNCGGRELLCQQKHFFNPKWSSVVCTWILNHFYYLNIVEFQTPKPKQFKTSHYKNIFKYFLISFPLFLPSFFFKKKGKTLPVWPKSVHTIYSLSAFFSTYTIHLESLNQLWSLTAIQSIILSRDNIYSVIPAKWASLEK